MADYFPIRQSQIPLCKNVPFYYKTADNEYNLYKKRGEIITFERLMGSRHPELFVRQQDKDTALIEIIGGLNKSLAESIVKGGLEQVKQVLSQIVDEALAPNQSKVWESLPNTVDILFEAYAKNHSVLESLSKIASNSKMMVDHTLNVMTFTLYYCFYNGIGEDKTKKQAEQEASRQALIYYGILE